MSLKMENCLLYAVTDTSWLRGRTLAQQVEEALRGGVTMVQLREKELDDESFIKEALEIKPLCRKYGAALIINDRIDVALKSGADGVHAGIEDMPIAKLREIAGDDFIIGATAKTVAQAQNAERSGADYLGVGAVFPSPTKTTALRITPQTLKEIASSVSIPSVAIGGITLDNVSGIACCGVSGIAVVSSLFGADDTELAAKALKAAAIKYLRDQ